MGLLPPAATGMILIPLVGIYSFILACPRFSYAGRPRAVPCRQKQDAPARLRYILRIIGTGLAPLPPCALELCVLRPAPHGPCPEAARGGREGGRGLALR